MHAYFIHISQGSVKRIYGDEI